MKKVIGLLVLLSVCVGLGSVVQAEEQIKPVKNQLIIVNKRINRLAFYQDGELIKIYKVATGRTAKLTPEGTFTVIKLYRNMPYYRLKIPGGDPRNPLGPRWIGLNVQGTAGFTYGIHGNAAPWSIGTNASSGCVRMYNEEVKELYSQLELGAKVIITRSSDNFDRIARNHKYLLTDDKATYSKAKIQINKTVTAYKRPSKYFKQVGQVPKSVLIVKKQYKNWYYVETPTVKGWINDGAITELDTPVKLLQYHFKAISRENKVVAKWVSVYQQVAAVRAVA
ncbi:L,D-transpeptidase [Priestia megaterium]|nr:L,D-transpeptidase [Priestia megaterium]